MSVYINVCLCVHSTAGLRQSSLSSNFYYMTCVKFLYICELWDSYSTNKCHLSNKNGVDGCRFSPCFYLNSQKAETFTRFTRDTRSSNCTSIYGFCSIFLNHLMHRLVSGAFMEETKNQIVHGKLNLNVPPLSTRRASGGTAFSGSRLDPANMVPFSWERIPGEPKDQPTIGGNDRPPPPKPPPAWWRPSVRVDDLDLDGSGGGGDRFDIFSLAESVDDVEGYCKATKERSSTILEASSDDCCSSNFIIERFLPDAQALAEESVMNKKLPFSDSSFSRAVSIGRSHQSMKGCGLGSFLPWKMKPKSCKVKSPVCDTIIGATLKQKR